jgi:site-specific recombinase XerD
MAHPPPPGSANPNPPLTEVNVAPTPQGKPEPRLLDQLRDAIRVRHYSIRTEEAYVQWVRRFIVSSKLRHPLDMGPDEVAAFLTHLAVDRDVAASTQNQAKSALLFLYRVVLNVALPWLDEIVSAKDGRRLPVVLTSTEVRSLLNELSGTTGLVVSMLYGTGMRLLEVLRFRVKDVGIERREKTVRDGKGSNDRLTVLPENLVLPLQAQIAKAKALHLRDLAVGAGRVWLPDALAVKYPHAALSWG